VRVEAVFPVPGAPWTQTVCAASARTMSSWSGWMVATMSRIGPDRGRSISSIRIWLGFWRPKLSAERSVVNGSSS
jgi:hypothetical protein